MLTLKRYVSGFYQPLQQWMTSGIFRQLERADIPSEPTFQASNEESPPQARLLQSSEGVLILRDGYAHSARSGLLLQLGDRVMVPRQGQAQFIFHEQGSKALLGRFEGGSIASLVHFSKEDGACSVAFDVLSGKVHLFMEAIGGNCLWVGRNTSGQTTVRIYCAPSRT